MRASVLIVLALAAVASAGPFGKSTNNQVESEKLQQQVGQNEYMTKQTGTVELLKQWCFASQMSQPELTVSFKKLVGIVKSSPEDQHTEGAVLSERICQGAVVPKSAHTGETIAAGKGADAQAHELIKDVYMDALIACDKSDCIKQLLKIINSNQVDPIRASYYMTRLAVAEQENVKDERDVKQLVESFVNERNQPATSEMVERQKLFAVTAMLAKALKNKTNQQQPITGELKQITEQVAKTIVERFIKPVGQTELQQFLEQQQPSEQIIKKIAKRNAALKALANIPGWMLQQVDGIEEVIVEIATSKDEQSTARQSAIECLEENESALKVLKQITFAQEEATEVRVAAYRALISLPFAPSMDKVEQQKEKKEQMAAEIIDELVKHCEHNQQTDDQFVLYVISHLDNLRSSEQPEHEALKEVIAKNKQHYMQIQLLVKKLKQQLNDVRRSSRNYKLAQQFAQLESGLIIEGDIVYESKDKQEQILPKMVRVNMSMPVMGETVNVLEITVRQNQMDEELLGALKVAQGAKISSQSVGRIVDQFKSSVEKQQQQRIQKGSNSNSNNNKQVASEADLTIKVEGCVVAYVSVDDFKCSSSGAAHQRATRSVFSVVDELLEQLKRKPIAFNRGFNLNINERLAKLIDLEANLIAGLRFESRASGHSTAGDFEIVAQVEPRFAFEAIVGPAKMSSKKLLQRFSTKTALGLRLRYKSNELVDVQLDLPLNTMELFTIESQLVEKRSQPSKSFGQQVDEDEEQQHSTYTYLPSSIYGQQDIYAPNFDLYAHDDDELTSVRMVKRSIFERKQSLAKSIGKMLKGNTFKHSFTSSEEVARATGLRGLVRVAVAPKDASLMLQALVFKVDQGMQGYRVQLQRQQRGQQQSEILFGVSAPGSRIERSMQIRLVQQRSAERTVVKADVQTNSKLAATVQCELVHDARQVALKVELASSTRAQWRHLVEVGFQRGSQSQSGRIAATYKPYVTIDSTHLRRPIQLQGALSYQQSPKSVITYELKCPNSGDFFQGKFILDAQRAAYLGKRQHQQRRSMASPIEILLEKELTLTGELVGQVREHSVKVHKMLDWNPSKVALKADLSVAHENVRKSQQNQIVAQLKVDGQQQMLTVERKCPQQSRNEFRLTILSDMQSATGHQMLCELRFNGKRASNQLVAYKHKVDMVKAISSKDNQMTFTVELIDSRHNLNEKLTGRAQLSLERNLKSLKGELSGRQQQLKTDMQFVSLGQHQIQVLYQNARVQHKCLVRCDARAFAVESTTEESGQTVAKLVMNVLKQKPEAQLLIEVPAKSTHVALDVQLAPGKLSSMAIQTGAFASKAQFSFDKMSRAGNKLSAIFGQSFANNYRFKSDLKDLMKRESYWLESAWNGDLERSSFLRMDSPVYRGELEFEPAQFTTKVGVFARSKRSTTLNREQLYAEEGSPLKQFEEKLGLGNKLWMARSMISSPSKLEELKQKALRGLFEYADRKQQHKHTLDWNPTEERVNFAFERQPSAAFATTTFKPIRMTGDLYTSLFAKQEQGQEQVRPSRVKLESQMVDFDLEAKPFDGEQAFARLSALSRHPRAAFSKHESEINYQKNQGYKAWMKHQDTKQKRHSLQFESDESPKKWAKIAYESDKLGKAHWEHQWRKESQRRQHPVRGDEQFYANRVTFKGESPITSDWRHQTDFQWEEPAQFVRSANANANKSWQRTRRSTFDEIELQTEAGQPRSFQDRFAAIDYLKHVNARVNSQTMNKQGEQLYKVDFDYQPESPRAALSVSMPNEMEHSSVFEYEPTERLYKAASKLYNRRTSQPTYELSASTKPVLALSSSQQKPQFIEERHPIYERPIDSQRMVAQILGQPIKVDYTDKQGRLARFDYDLSPVVSGANYAGLRQKRAALYYKDESANIEHQSSFDFHPEQLLTSFKQQSKRLPADLVLKTNTKYGPVMLRVDSNQDTLDLELLSPVVNAKLTGETGKRGTAQLIKIQLDNKHQNCQLAKVVRKTPILADIYALQRMAQKFDQSRFEHQTELLVSMVDAIFKVKSQTKVNEHQVMVIEGELNKQQEKVVVRVDGKRVKGQAIVDLAHNTANLVLDVDDKRTLQHQTRIVRLSDKFFSIDSMTSYKQQPLLKLTGKISALVFTEPQHLFSSRRTGFSGEEHISQFEAIVYQPKQILVRGHYDCINKEARVVFENRDEKKIQETHIKFDQQTETIRMDSRLTSPYGTLYTTEAKINLPGLYQSDKCQHQTCSSDVIYQDKSGEWTAKYIPGEKIAFSSPMRQQIINLAY